MEKITLTNKFHNTETRTNVNSDGTIPNMKTALKRLCGIRTCQCGGCDQFNTGEVYEVREGVWKTR